MPRAKQVRLITQESMKVRRRRGSSSHFCLNRNTNILQYFTNYSTASALEQAATKPYIQKIRTEILQHWTRNVSAAGFVSTWFRFPLVPGCSSSAD